MEKGIIYIRADKKLERYVDEEEQEKIARQYAIENNITICNVFRDFNDGEPYGQPELCKAIDYCKNHLIEMIVMYDYKVLSHKYMKRVLNAKSIHQNNLRISFASNCVLYEQI